MCPAEQESSKSYTRTQQRSLIFHLLYALEVSEEQSVASAIDNINQGYEQDISQDGHIAQSVESIINQRSFLDETIQSFLENWRLNRLGLCTRIILRLGVWELLFTDEPPSIIINEAIELAKDFAEKDAYKFINGILDQVADKRETLKEE
jgi:transcription antitermination protein NusB